MERAYSKAAGDIHRPAGRWPDPKDGIYTLLKGAIVRAVDEFQLGYGKGFSVEVSDKYATVRDFGRSIPLENVVSATSGISAGIGANPKEVTVHPVKVTNALSIDFYVASYCDGNVLGRSISREIFSRKESRKRPKITASTSSLCQIRRYLPGMLSKKR